MIKKELHIIFLISFFTFGKVVWAQDTVVQNGYVVFYYPGGMKSSEGTMKDGKPDAYWKTYYENGVLKSEGNRKNFLLDSLWKFYSDSGKIILEVNYREGRKNGSRKTWQKDIIIEENFVDDVKNGFSFQYYADGHIRRKVNFINGREEGIAREYATDGTVITLTEYRKGYIINTENINRTRDGLKHGLWKTFYEDESVATEGTYNYGKRDGYFKEFGRDGNLVSITKYINDELIPDAPELANYEIRTEYYKNGRIKTVQSFKDGIAEGIRRDYAQDGSIIRSYIFRNGYVSGEGIVDEKGYRQGPWVLYYESGEKEAEGEYNNGTRKGPWKFYYREGNLEQSGTYNDAGRIIGKWKWFYESGNLRREEVFSNGLPDGPMKEYSDSGSVIISGNYVEGEEDGEWFYEVGDNRETGVYIEGKRDGEWKHFCNGILYFRGEYLDGNPNGEHIYYWDNGKIREKGKYVMGKKEGEWVLYNYDGTRLLAIYFVDGIEKTYDGGKIEDKEIIEKQ